MSVAKSSTVSAPRSCSRSTAASVRARPTPWRRASGATPRAPIQPVAPNETQHTAPAAAPSIRSSATSTSPCGLVRGKATSRETVGPKAARDSRSAIAPASSWRASRTAATMGRTNARGPGYASGSRSTTRSRSTGAAYGGASRAGVHEEPDDEADDAGDHEDQPDGRQVDARDRVGHGVTQNRAHGDEEDAASNGHVASLSRSATRLHPRRRLYDGAMSATLTDIYDLPQEHKDFRATIRQIVDEKVRPRAAEIDATGEYPWDVRKLFAEQDILALPFDAAVRRHRAPARSCSRSRSRRSPRRARRARSSSWSRSSARCRSRSSAPTSSRSACCRAARRASGRRPSR